MAQSRLISRLHRVAMSSASAATFIDQHFPRESANRIKVSRLFSHKSGIAMAQKSYAQIQKQIEALQRQADGLRAQEVAGVVARIKEAIAHYGLTAEQLGYGTVARGAKAKAQKVGRTGVPAYSDGLGNSWGGRGPRPQWLKSAIAVGRTLEEFASAGRYVPAKAKKNAKKVKSTAPKKRTGKTYRDATGNTWSGFGPRPRWLREALEAGQTLEQLATSET